MVKIFPLPTGQLLSWPLPSGRPPLLSAQCWCWSSYCIMQSAWPTSLAGGSLFGPPPLAPMLVACSQKRGAVQAADKRSSGEQHGVLLVPQKRSLPVQPPGRTFGRALVVLKVWQLWRVVQQGVKVVALRHLPPALAQRVALRRGSSPSHRHRRALRPRHPPSHTAASWWI